MDQKDSDRETNQTGSTSEKRQRDFDSKLDEYANKISQVVSDGVKRVEEAFDRGRENLKASDAEGGAKGLKGSPKSGIILIGIGIVWLLYIVGLFEHVIFPIILIILGIYFIIRNR
jgi:hypothetical protein